MGILRPTIDHYELIVREELAKKRHSEMLMLEAYKP